VRPRRRLDRAPPRRYHAGVCDTARTTGRRGTFRGQVLSNERICDEHYRLVLHVPGFPPSRAGQFVQLQCRRPGLLAGSRPVDWPEGAAPQFTQPELTGAEPLLGRPMSVASARAGADGAVELQIIYRTTGIGTHWLAGAGPGDDLSLLGPLGCAFPVRTRKALAVLVGGGAGIPPMLYLAEALAAAGTKTVAFSGARSASLLPLKVLPDAAVSPDAAPARCVAEFAERNADAVLATDDGSLGFAGTVTAAFERWLDRSGVSPDDLVAYSCGPEPMMRAVGDACIARGIECYLSMERHMGCGMGTCQSCIVKVRDDSERGWSYRLCCTDGPVFDAREILWT